HVVLVSRSAGPLADLQHQWEERVADLRNTVKEIKGERSKAEALVTSDMVALSDKEKEIVASVRRMEKDEKDLRKEENAVTRRVEELEHAQREFGRMKTIFDRKVDEFEKREQEIREREDFIARAVADVEKAQERAHAAMEKIRNAKELHQNIELLQKKQKELESTIERSSRRLIALSHKQPVLPVAAAKAKKEHKTVEETHEEIVEPVLEEHITPGPMSPMPVKEKHHRAPPADPVQLVADARRAYEAGDYKEAHTTLLKAEHLLPKLKGEAKRDLAYDIWDLKTSLRLVTLA
ncbi:MAG: hypothetical protein AABY13_05360, partial [Nanoarchaeota archaeon]